MCEQLAVYVLDVCLCAVRGLINLCGVRQGSGVGEGVNGIILCVRSVVRQGACVCFGCVTGYVFLGGLLEECTSEECAVLATVGSYCT